MRGLPARIGNIMSRKAEIFVAISILWLLTAFALACNNAESHGGTFADGVFLKGFMAGGLVPVMVVWGIACIIPKLRRG